MSTATSHAKAPYYFIPEPSRWPAVGSLAMLFVISGASLTVNAYRPGPWLLAIGLLILVYMMAGWFAQVIGESQSGVYGKRVDLSFRWSMSWFIFSEVMFFAAFFGGCSGPTSPAPGRTRARPARSRRSRS